MLIDVVFSFLGIVSLMESRPNRLGQTLSRFIAGLAPHHFFQQYVYEAKHQKELWNLNPDRR